MPSKRFMPLGPLLAGGGSRAFLGVESRPEGPRPVVFIWAPDEVVRDSERLARLKRDTEMASRLDHPNIIQVVGFEHLDEGVARVVAFADGESLRRIIDTAKSTGVQLPPELGARIVADACFGVHYAHEMGDTEDDRPIVHGVLRPEMLMVSFDGSTKVTGYGAAEVAPRDEAGKFISGKAYFAPEQITGGLSAAGRATDIYALGAILYEVLSGRPPFEAEPDLDIAVLTREPPSFSLVTAPEALVKVALHAMAKKAVDRYPSALALREAIETALGAPSPTVKEVAAFVAQVFPPNSREREARRQLLASVMSVSGMHMIPENEVLPPPPSDRPAAPPPPTPVTSVAVAPSPKVVAPTSVPSKAPPAVSKAPAQALPRTVSEPEVPKPGVSFSRIVVPIVLIVAVAIPLWLRSRTPGEHRAGASETSAAPAQTPSGSAASPAVKPPAPARAAPGPAPAPERQVAAPARTPLRRPEPDAPGTLELDADPKGEVLIDGKSVGRSPIKTNLPAGRHSVRIVDKAKGVDVGRTVRIEAGRRTEEKIVLLSASLAITAPAGAEIFVDNRRVGKAPIQPVEFYEGPHRVLVTFNGAKMEKKFIARGGDKLTLDVQPTP